MNYDENRRTYRDNFTTKATIEATERGYRVDDDGNVLNPQGVQLKTWPDTRGYLRFSLSTETKKVGNRKIYVHQLAAYQKFGRIVFAHGVEVRHLDNNHLNNSTSNLSYGSSSENEMDKLQRSTHLHRTEGRRSQAQALCRKRLRTSAANEPLGPRFNSLLMNTASRRAPSRTSSTTKPTGPMKCQTTNTGTCTNGLRSRGTDAPK